MRIAQHRVNGRGVYLVPNVAPAGNQLNIGCCVWMATRGALWTAARNTPEMAMTYEPISALHGYWIDCVEQGLEDDDPGSYSERALEIMALTGACRDSLFPLTDANFRDDAGKRVRPPLPTYQDAKPVPSMQWAACPTLDDAEDAIIDGHPVIFGTAVDSTIFSYQVGGLLTAPNPHDIQGGHEMLITGVDTRAGKRLWRVLNSWGEAWGDNGSCWGDDGFVGNTTAGGFYTLEAL